ncbi:hypothetical protein HDU93_003044 [Gonapodya sp. JEL0774]|nr:hypothetical protein HDU93_003044 [Gonapodya sp. JEL0774]
MLPTYLTSLPAVYTYPVLNHQTPDGLTFGFLPAGSAISTPQPAIALSAASPSHHISQAPASILSLPLDVSSSTPHQDQYPVACTIPLGWPPASIVNPHPNSGTEIDESHEMSAKPQFDDQANYTVVPVYNQGPIILPPPVGHQFHYQPITRTASLRSDVHLSLSVQEGRNQDSEYGIALQHTWDDSNHAELQHKLDVDSSYVSRAVQDLLFGADDDDDGAAGGPHAEEDPLMSSGSSTSGPGDQFQENEDEDDESPNSHVHAHDLARAHVDAARESSVTPGAPACTDSSVVDGDARSEADDASVSDNGDSSSDEEDDVSVMDHSTSTYTSSLSDHPPLFAMASSLIENTSSSSSATSPSSTATVTSSKRKRTSAASEPDDYFIVKRSRTGAVNSAPTGLRVQVLGSSQNQNSDTQPVTPISPARSTVLERVASADSVRSSSRRGSPAPAAHAHLPSPALSPARSDTASTKSESRSSGLSINTAVGGDDDASSPLTPVGSAGGANSVPKSLATRLSKLSQEELEGRTFRCDNCPAAFVRKHDLRRHERIHLGLKPYVCRFCSKAFARLDAMNRHTMLKNCKKPAASGTSSKKGRAEEEAAEESDE